MTLSLRSTARRFTEYPTRPVFSDDRGAPAVEARMISQIEQALYPILVTDEADPADQAMKRAQVAEIARAAWMRFASL